MSINSDRLREFFNSDVTDAAADELDELEEKLAASEARVGVLTEALVPHIADLRRCAAILRTSELAEKFIGTADEFDRAAEELNAAIGSASHD